MLNKKQLQAVKTIKHPLLIIAGAGTGKTTVIIEKIKYLIKQKKVKPEQILALTFTEKAAQEMEERIDQSLPYGYSSITIDTFHSFAHQILRNEVINIGLTPSFNLMGETDSLIFLKKNLYQFKLRYFRPLTNPNKYLSSLIQYFGRLQEENIDPISYLNWSKKNLKKNLSPETRIEMEKNLELALAYKKYLDLKITEGLMEFSDLIYYLNQLFIKRPDILKDYQKKFQYVLVDEFQDTNLIQYQLIKLLCPAKNNPSLIVVGDDSQSIYKFRGASISNILNFMKDYPTAKCITLIKNYRSNQTILNQAYRLIKHNDPDTLEAKLGISKKLVSNKKDNKKAVNFLLFDRVEQEADFIVRTILKLKDSYSLSDFAILVRSHSHSQPFVKTLENQGVSYQFYGPGALFKQPEIKDLIALLRLINDLDDSVSCFRVLSLEIFSLDRKDIHTLLSFAKKINQSLFQSIEIYLSFFYKEIEDHQFKVFYPYLPLLKQNTKEKLMFFYQLMKKTLAKSRTYSGGQILYFFLEKSGLLTKISHPKSENEEKILLNISRFFDKIKSFEVTHSDVSVFSLADWLSINLELGESPLASQADLPLSKNAVNIITIHSAKGLEFPVVFLVNLSQGRFPVHQKKEPISIPQELIQEILPTGNYHEQEERRLFYVGMTRAANLLYLTASKLYYEGKRERKISQFVVEALGEQKLITKAKLKSETVINEFKINESLTSTSVKKKSHFNLQNISYSQIETFNTCPLQYYYQYIQNIPTTQSANESFGTTIHKTLESFYRKFFNNRNLSLENLLQDYKKNWIPVGYVSSIQEKRMKKEGEEMLKKYFSNYHHPTLKIIFLEKKFKIKLTPTINLIGKIDRIDKLNNSKIELIDYKTGKKPEEKEIKKSIQLGIYALVAKDKNFLNASLSKIKLSFFYLQFNEKISFKLKNKDLKNIQEKILETIDKINQSSFNPKVGPWCDFCPFKILCTAWQI